jgi:hypothetical protein
MLVRPGMGGYGPGGTVADLARWLGDAGLVRTTVEPANLFAYFSAWRPEARAHS